MNLITLSNLKEYLDGKTDTQHDRMLQTMISGVSDTIQTHLNRFLEFQQYIEYFEATNFRNKYWLKAYPLVISETYPFTVTVNGEEYTIDDDYYVREESGLLEFYIAPVYQYPKGIKVEHYGGYEVIDDSTDEDGSLAVPDTIKLATYMQCSYMFKRRNDIGTTWVQMPETIRGSSGMLKKPDKSTKLLPEVAAMLAPYRRTPGEW